MAVVGRCSYARIGRALSISPQHISRMATGSRPTPIYIEAIIELLERLPPKDWPARWTE